MNDLSYTDLIKNGYRISKQTFKRKCFSGELNYKKTHWSRNNPEMVIIVIHESELPKLEKYNKGKGDLVFNPKSQQEYYIKLWAEEDRRKEAEQAKRAEIEAKKEKRYSYDYREYLQSPEWKEKRQQRIQLDNRQCQNCGTAKNLQVHHITYEHLGHEPMEDLVTLCDKCHKKVHEHDIKK